MSYLDPNRGPLANRGQLRRERIMQDAANRELVAEAMRDGDRPPPSGLRRILARLRGKRDRR